MKEWRKNWKRYAIYLSIMMSYFVIVAIAICLLLSRIVDILNIDPVKYEMTDAKFWLFAAEFALLAGLAVVFYLLGFLSLSERLVTSSWFRRLQDGTR